MNDLTVNSSRGIGQWLTLLLSMIFRNQFSAGVIVQSVGGIMILLGATLAIWGRMTLGQAFTSTLSPKGLVTTGIYSKLRHPMYTGGVLFFLRFRSAASIGRWIGTDRAIGDSAYSIFSESGGKRDVRKVWR